MSKVFIEESTLTAIGNAIRGRSGGAELISPADMATKIANLPSGGGEPGNVANLAGFSIMRIGQGATVGTSPAIDYQGYATLTFKARRRSPLSAYDSDGNLQSQGAIYVYYDYVQVNDGSMYWNESEAFSATMDSDDVVTYTVDLTQPPYSTATVKRLALQAIFIDNYTAEVSKFFDIFDIQLSGVFAHTDNSTSTWSEVSSFWNPSINQYYVDAYTELINPPVTKTSVAFQGYAISYSSNRALQAYIDIVGINKETKLLEKIKRVTILYASAGGNGYSDSQQLAITLDGSESETYEKIGLRLRVLQPTTITTDDSGFATIRNISFSA